MTLTEGSQIRHPRLGLGILVALQVDGIAIVDFLQEGLQRVHAAELEVMDDLFSRLENGPYDPPLETVTRLLAFAIQSVQQTWGVFSRSRIQLLPHQLWVCKKTLETWPPRWMVADDVGLGKTIEAGLIMKALQARGRLGRMLVLCPASLVSQWQWRLRTMFRILTTAYSNQADQPEGGFWEQQRLVVASLHTLREDLKGRHGRLLDSDAWDLVVVDEAHHLGSTDRDDTLAFDLLKKLTQADKVKGMLFFSGTPHKGIDYGFLALMRLLRADLFTPEEPLRDQLHHLPKAMIRNSKAAATDLKGKRLFHGTRIVDHTFVFSESEQAFYDRLTAFIREGLLYGQSLGTGQASAVGLVLIVLQKLAASSVAAVARALRRRLDSLKGNQARLDQLQEAKKVLERYQDSNTSLDSSAALEELQWDMALLEDKVSLVQNELPYLEELITLASRVDMETKLKEILRCLDSPEQEGGLQGRTVLFFTEYKATQSMLMSHLKVAFGNDSTGFINGDECALGVKLGDGRVVDLRESREIAARKFNDGEYRFLVSTEAAGEGIDLQGNCHTLIHVDLPWNPMRMQQRVGRLYRYGQSRQVDVHTFRNPGTVESRIYELLTEKLHRVSEAFSVASEQPEDMLQLVLGMVEPGFYEQLARLAMREEPTDKLQSWVDSGFGGAGVVSMARNLIGNVAQFDFQGVGLDLPQVDLPDLKPFFKAMLAVHNREWMEDPDGAGTFLTPESWLHEHGLAPRYEKMRFDRETTDPTRSLGADHKCFSRGLEALMQRTDSVALLPASLWKAGHLAIFRISQQIDPDSAGPDLVVGVNIQDDLLTLVKDWELVKELGSIADSPRRLRPNESNRPGSVPQELRSRVFEFVKNHAVVQHAFPNPKCECLGILLSSGRAE